MICPGRTGPSHGPAWKPEFGGVMEVRLRASEKKAQISAGEAGSHWEWEKTWIFMGVVKYTCVA